MDRRIWLWKKKPFEKTVSSADSERESVAASVVIQADQDTTKDESYVRISVESYARLAELENHVKDLNRKLTSVHENLSSAQSEIKAKDIIVKQHAKVAEDAISGVLCLPLNLYTQICFHLKTPTLSSKFPRALRYSLEYFSSFLSPTVNVDCYDSLINLGWEKAEAESLALNHQLESVTVLKLTAEEKVSHLDGALRECTKQMRKMKEDSEQKLQDVVFTKTKQWEKINADMQARIADFEQKLLRASSENAALSRSLQERSNMLTKITEEKSQADAEIEMLRNNLQSCEKEISSFDYELNILSKELEIRNEEKNMVMRSAEVANKQHSEDVKKITKLEAECQRLRNLVRKKLPGPAALAQMKLEVENLGRDYGENRMRRGSNPQHILVPDFAFENIQQCYKENEFLTSRLLAMEEETKMLKEALTRKNSELQDSQNLSEKTMDKLQSIETHIIAFNQQKSPSKSTINLDIESESNPQSLSVMSKDGIDEDRSYYESWVALLPLEASQLKKGNDKGTKRDQLELMDDFLEMERFACQSTETNGSAVISNDTQDKMETVNDIAISIVTSQDNASGKERESDLEQSIHHASCNEEPPAMEFTSDKNDGPRLKLQSRIASIFESESPENDITETLERIRYILQDTHEELPHHYESCSIEETQATTCEQNHHDEASGDFTNSSIPLEIDIRTDSGTSNPFDQDFKNAISRIYDSIVSLGKIVLEIQDFTSDDHSLSKKIDEFSSSHNKVLCNELSLHEFILTLSCILSEATELVSSEESNRDIDASECIDKVALLENEVDQHELTKDTSLGTSSSSGLEIEEVIGQDIVMKNALRLYSMEEFEQLKVEKENLLTDLDCQTKLLDETKQKFVEIEVELTELKFKLTASEKSNSLAETQLKCMAESYKSLELRTQEMELQKQELENEINVLRTNVELLKNELQEERHNHQIDLAKYDKLQEKIIREGKPSLCPFPQDTDVGVKTKQEKELAATAEKLAECQETIFLLGRQLKAMHSSEEPMSFSLNNKRRMSDFVLGNEPSPSLNLKGNSGSQNLYHDDTENTTNPVNRRTGGETPLEIYNYQLSPSYSEVGLFPRSPINSERQKHRLSEFSSSTLSTTSSEKHGRGISRFFSMGKKE